MKAWVASIQLCPGHRQEMRLVEVANLIPGVGIEGDKHAEAASKRQVLIADQEALDVLDLPVGAIKENLTVAGLNVMALQPGTRLHIGSSVVLEVTSECKPCFRMDEIRPGLRVELEGRRGMNSRVIEGGQLRVGDEIVVEPQALIA
jgi:MOSC domain-containing protein YiiM